MIKQENYFASDSQVQICLPLFIDTKRDTDKKDKSLGLWIFALLLQIKIEKGNQDSQHVTNVR